MQPRASSTKLFPRFTLNHKKNQRNQKSETMKPLDDCRWTVAFALLLMLAVEVVDAEDGMTKVRHRVCCVQLPDYRKKTSFSGKPLRDWADSLNRLFVNDTFGGENAECIHEFGYDDVGHPDDRWTLTYPRSSGRLFAKDAPCATIILSVSGKRLKTEVDLFTPEFLEGITRGRPSVEIELGMSDMAINRGALEVLVYDQEDLIRYNYEEVYEGNRRFATEDELRVVVSTQVCKKMIKKFNWLPYECDIAMKFIEVLTEYIIPDEPELGVLTKDEMKKFLTIEKLRSVNFPKEIRKREKQVEKLKDLYQVLQIRPEMKTPSGAKAKLSSSSSSTTSPTPTPYPYSDLLYFLNIFREVAIIPPPRWIFRMRSALGEGTVPSLKVTQGTQKSSMPKVGRSVKTSKKTETQQGGGGGKGASPQQITAFLLVKSLLTVSEINYADVIASGAIHKLQRTRMPIFSVCAEMITRDWLPGPNSFCPDWLSSRYPFTIAGSRHSSFEYQKLNEVNPKDFSQCAVLALVGVPEEGFRNLTRQSFDMIFGIFTRGEINAPEIDNFVIRSKDDNVLRSVSMGSAIDPWELIPDMYSSSLTLDQMFNQAAESIEESGSPEWPKARPRSKSSRSGSRKSST